MRDTRETQALYRAIPSIDRCLDRVCAPPEGADRDALAAASLPRPLLKNAIAAYWKEVRARVREGAFTSAGELALERHAPAMIARCLRDAAPRLRRVVNGTGVVIHTNTGRSVLAQAAARAVASAAAAYSTLEFNRDTGGRGSRDDIVSSLIRELTGAEDGLAVNNNAAAVLLALDTFCKGGEVVISRGELVEIGGSFRIPDVMESTGVRLREVGSTNRTHFEDYTNALGDQTRAIIRVHTSNYRIIGFHAAVPTRDLADLAHSRGLPLIHDLGSGSLMDLAPYGLPHEPTITEAVRHGADLVLFSGDKLLGGPQAGVIAGRADLVARIRKNPLLRALRVDKLTLAGLEATLRLYLDPRQALKAVPTLRMAVTSRRVLAARAASLRRALERALGDRARVALMPASSRMGGGAYPEADMPTTLVAVTLTGVSADGLRLRLLAGDPIVIGRIEEDAFCLDPRTLLEGDATRVTSAMVAALTRNER